MTTGYDTQRVTTADNVGISFRVAGLATRLTAAIFDALILTCILTVATVLIVAIADAATGNTSGNGAVEIFSLASYLLAAAWLLIVVAYFTVARR